MSKGTNMTKDEALKLALEALGNTWTEPKSEQYKIEKEAITAIKEALAQPKQGPVAWMYVGTHVTKPIHTDDVDYEQISHDDEWFPVYLQPQSTWVGLTYEEQRELYKKHDMDGWGHFYNAIEAKLKEKNRC